MDSLAQITSNFSNPLGTWDDENSGPPPGTPPTKTFEGPWFRTQLTISLALGVVSFFLFSYARTRWPVLFAPRTKLKGFSPHEAHAQSAFFGWILPTIRTSEITILQIVGLDAAVLLNFFKMSFLLFSVMSVLAVAVIMPINFKNNIGMGVGDDDDDTDWVSSFFLSSYADVPRTAPNPSTGQGRDWMDLLNDANSYLSLHLAFTYLFTFLALRFVYKNYTRFVRVRQLFSLELVHSIAGRTVLVTQVPMHLRGERALAVYFENMGMQVESVGLVREVGGLEGLLKRRTEALLELEKRWTEYLGNPSSVDVYDPSDNAVPPLIDLEEGNGNIRSGYEPSYGNSDSRRSHPSIVVPHRKRPTVRPGWFKPKTDALEYYEEQFKKADEAVHQRRQTGKFKASHVAFVTFEKMSSAQIAAQVAHAPYSNQCRTVPAPEPRDIVWDNIALTPASVRLRNVIVVALMVVLFLFWAVPISALATLLSYEEIKKAMPWLGRLVDANDTVRAIVQNLLPSVGIISLNALLPFLFEALTYVQGSRARSWVEYSVLKKYHLFLLINVIFIFLLASTYWQLIRDLAESPAKVPEKIATALHQGRARYFFLSYVLLQALGIMPMQLLNLGVVLPRFFFRAFITRTPRDFAELNAPPMINYGVVYPQAILVFTVTMLYSVIQPTILIFGALYFGIGYVVYKYKLLFVFYKPYESQGQAWPITFARLIWGLVIFQVFMTGLFLLKKGVILSSLMLPLIFFTVSWAWYTSRSFEPLSKNVNLSSVVEVERGEESEEVVRMREGHPVTWSQSNLNRRRYAQNDETLYVAPEDERTDYSQPPMSNWFYGVLNTGKRRYGHPALTGVLPQPWLPLKKGQTLVNRDLSASNEGSRPGLFSSLSSGGKAKNKPSEAVVLTMRKRYSSLGKRRSRSISQALASRSGKSAPSGGEGERSGYSDADSTINNNPWSDLPAGDPGLSATNGRRLKPRFSFDGASGVIMLPEDANWLMEDVDSENNSSGDSDEEFHSDAGTETSQTAPVVVTVPRSRSDGPVNNAESSAGPSTTVLSTTPSQMEGGLGVASSASTTTLTPSKRHGTYYHHPERTRKRSIVSFNSGPGRP